MRMITGFWAASLTACVGLAAWYQIDRTTLLKSACEVGFPNFSRPADVAQSDLGCAILGPKSVYSGVIVTGFETSRFSSPDFTAGIASSKQADDRSWFHCPKDGCGKDLTGELSREYVCIGAGLASITVEGRPTVSKGAFGHLGAYPREFFATRIITVSPAPDEMVRDWVTAFRVRGLCR